MDLSWRKIPNEFLLAGFCTLLTRMILHPCEVPLLSIAWGALIPFGILIGFFYFRMVGAGDIKLLMLLGGFVGRSRVLEFLMLTAAAGLCCSIVLMIRYASLERRLRYFAGYIQTYLTTGSRQPYRKEWEKGASIHFTIPIWIGVILNGLF